MNHKASLILLPAYLFLFSCGGGDGDNTSNLDYQYTVPEQTNDGWAVADAQQEGLTQETIASLNHAISNKVFTGIDSVVLIKNGMLVHEAYFNGYSRDKLHDLRSATKSITSILVGVAVDNQNITDENSPALNYVDNYLSYKNPDTRKYDISIESFLTMSPGLACNDWVPSSPGNEEKMYKQQDWVKFILDLPMVVDPGTEFGYCTGGVVVLGEVIQGATGMSAAEFASLNLFQPMGIENHRWQYTPNGQVDTGGHLHMRPRDMAKIGQLMLRNGHWESGPLISERWVEKSTRHHIFTSDGNSYGYLWWRRMFTCCGPSLTAFYASGNGGQYIFVFPDIELVAVFTGSNYDSRQQIQPFLMLRDYILPGVE